jgi:hypothetical protein
LSPGIDLAKHNEDYLARNRNCASKMLAAIKARKLILPESAPSVEKDIIGILDVLSVTLEEAQEAFSLLGSWKSTELEAFRLLAEAKWPKAAVFSAST